MSIQINYNVQTQLPTISSNIIPNSQTFLGTIYSKSGLFLKSFSGYRIVCISDGANFGNSYDILNNSVTVYNYKPVDLEITVK